MKIADIPMDIEVRKECCKQLRFSQLLISESTQAEYTKLDELLTEYEKDKLIISEIPEEDSFCPPYE